MKKKFEILCASVIFLIWPSIIAYLFYLGISTGDWLSPQFMKWEIISLFCVPAFMGGGLMILNIMSNEAQP